MSKYDLVIKNGTIIDGLQTPRYRGDIGVKDGKIVEMGSNLAGAHADKVIDAAGNVVAPGFVDLHTHYDSQLFWDPYCTMSGWHGVTSVAIGNCGFGFAPCKPEDRERAMLALTRNEAVPLKTMQAGLPWDWETFGQFLDSVDRTPKGVNILSFVPLAPVYGYVVGLDEAKKRNATEEELQKMCDILKEGMEVGGCGFSVQISPNGVQTDFDGTPMVTDTMPDRDLRAFSRAMGSLGRGVAQITGAMDFAEIMARESGRPVIWNALGVDGALNQHGRLGVESQTVKIEKLRRLNEEEGVRLYAQASTVNFQSQFTLEDYNLADTIPVWKEALAGSDVKVKMQKLADPERRAKMKEIQDARGGLWGAGYVMRDITVAWIPVDVPNGLELQRKYEGYSLGEIADRENKHTLDVLLDLSLLGNLQVGFATKMLKAPVENMREVANSTMALPGLSDGGAHTKFITTGRYPTELLGYWVREHKIMELEQAHWRLSTYPAQAAGLKNRGWLAEGLPADIVIYNPDTVDSLPGERLWDYPANEWRLVQKAVGYHHIIVNGVETFRDGECTNEVPGKLLRHGVA